MKTVEAGMRIALNNILFATDFSRCSNAALPYALAVARRYGATLHVAYVMPTEADLLLMSAGNLPVVAEEEGKRIQGCIDQLENQLQGLPHDVLTPRGEVPDALPRSSKDERLICSCSVLTAARASANYYWVLSPRKFSGAPLALF
jgi:universal stress protein family protein